MELAFFVGAGTIGIAWLLITIIGVTIHDIRVVAFMREQRQHPHARRWRTRPLVSVIYADEPSDDQLSTIAKSNHKKHEIVKVGKKARGQMLLTLPNNDVLANDSLRNAVRKIQYYVSHRRVEIVPVFRSPQTITELFSLYKRLALLPFVSFREAMNITTAPSLWPVLSDKNTYVPTWRDTTYATTKWIVSVTNLAVLCYICFFAFMTAQPDLLLLYVAGFGLWMLWSIASYPYFSFTQKLTLFALSPISLWYFGYLALRAPFVQIHDASPMAYARIAMLK